MCCGERSCECDLPYRKGWEVLGAQAAPKAEFPSAMEASLSLLLLLLAPGVLWAGEWELSKGGNA